MADAHTVSHFSPQTTTGGQFSRLKSPVKRSRALSTLPSLDDVPQIHMGACYLRFLDFSKSFFLRHPERVRLSPATGKTNRVTCRRFIVTCLMTICYRSNRWMFFRVAGSKIAANLTGDDIEDRDAMMLKSRSLSGSQRASALQGKANRCEAAKTHHRKRRMTNYSCRSLLQRSRGIHGNVMLKRMVVISGSSIILMSFALKSGAPNTIPPHRSTEWVMAGSAAQSLR